MNFKKKIQIAILAKIKLLLFIFDRKSETKMQYFAYLLVVLLYFINFYCIIIITEVLIAAFGKSTLLAVRPV